MARFLQRLFPNYERKSPITFLALCWIAGFLFGIILHFFAGDTTVSLMRSAAQSPVSIVSLLGSCLLPFFISAFAVFISKPGFLYVFSFLRTALFAYVSAGTMTAFGSSGWLIHYFLMFSDIGSMILLYLYTRRHISGMRRFSAAEAGLYIAIAFLISCMDYCYVAPYLARLV